MLCNVTSCPVLHFVNAVLLGCYCFCRSWIRWRRYFVSVPQPRIRWIYPANFEGNCASLCSTIRCPPGKTSPTTSVSIRARIYATVRYITWNSVTLYGIALHYTWPQLRYISVKLYYRSDAGSCSNDRDSVPVWHGSESVEHKWHPHSTGMYSASLAVRPQPAQHGSTGEGSSVSMLQGQPHPDPRRDGTTRSRSASAASVYGHSVNCTPLSSSSFSILTIDC